MLTHEQVEQLKEGDTLWRCYGVGIRPENLRATVKGVWRDDNNRWVIHVDWSGGLTYIFESTGAFARWAISEAHAKIEWTGAGSMQAEFPRPVSSFADVLSLGEWDEHIKHGVTIPGIDGSGYWVVDGMEVEHVTNERPPLVTHVAWYNK